MPRIRSYRPADWDSFLALDLETGLSTLRQSPQEEKDSFVARWAQTLQTSWGWTDAGPTKDNSSLLILEDDDGTFAGHLWMREEVERALGRDAPLGAHGGDRRQLPLARLGSPLDGARGRGGADAKARLRRPLGGRGQRRRA